MFLASSLTGSHFFEDTGLAEKIFLLGIKLLCILLLTVDKATEVRLLATVTLVERAAIVGKFLRLAVIDVVLSKKSLIIEDALSLGVQEGLFLNSLFEREERTELTGDRLGQAHNINLLFAARAAHEGESDSESCPFVLEKLNDAICVEDVTAGKSGASLGPELGSVADCAQLVFVDTLEVSSSLSAVCMKAGKAAVLLGDTFASMATLLMSLFTEFDCWLPNFFNSVLITSVNLNDFAIVFESWKLEGVAFRDN